MEKHKCCNCDAQISLYRAFCSKDCEEAFSKKYLKEAEK